LHAHTPWLYVEGDNGLGGRLALAGLLLVVLGQALGLKLLCLLVDLVVVAAEQVDLVVFLLSRLLRCLGGVDSEGGGLRAIGSEVLGWVAGQGVELALEGEEVVVPAPCVRVLLWCGDLLDLLEDLDVGL
jgi:hypothetical protein